MSQKNLWRTENLVHAFNKLNHKKKQSGQEWSNVLKKNQQQKNQQVMSRKENLTNGFNE